MGVNSLYAPWKRVSRTDWGMEACALQDEVLVVVTAGRPMIVDVGWRIRVVDEASRTSWVVRWAPDIRRRNKENILIPMMTIAESKNFWSRDNHFAGLSPPFNELLISDVSRRSIATPPRM
jgi:hypothetical protein